jgi:hypothetical protein
MQRSSESQLWLDNFRKRHGRSPRILHIGNIANNAYNNAKLLNEVGLDCDVICYDYYHIMGCPEWEDANFTGHIENDFQPDWTKVDLGGFVRPRWFAQGPLRDCVDYLIAKREDNNQYAEKIWNRLSILNGSKSSTGYFSSLNRRFRQHLVRIKRTLIFSATQKGAASLIANICDSGRIAAITNSEILRLLAASSLISIVIFIRAISLPFKGLRSSDPFDAKVAQLQDFFCKAFPERQFHLNSSDLEQYRNLISHLHQLFKSYDLVQAYSLDPILPLLASHPYVAFEHGTIRNIPYKDSAVGRLCALSYRLSDWAVITNADNMNSARRLEIPRFSFVPHPINENGIFFNRIDSDLRAELEDKYKTKYIVFHPARQHWTEDRHPDWEKGNDVFLTGFSRFVREECQSAIAVLVNWGATVDQSRRLIERLGIAKNVIWVPTMPHLKMVEYIRACDLVADQFYLGAFGSTLPKALACGRISMLYLNTDIHSECFPQMPPILNSRTSEEVFNHLVVASREKQRVEEIESLGKLWYQRYHSNTLICEKLISIYSDVLNRYN